MNRDYEIKERVENLQQIMEKIDVLAVELTMETGCWELHQTKRNKLLAMCLTDYTQEALDSANKLLNFISTRQQEQIALEADEGAIWQD